MIPLLRTHLRPFRKLLLAIIALQAVQAFASLYLPDLNADVIDEGIIGGDTGRIWSLGGVMLGVTLIQVTFAVAAVYCSARAAMGFGREVRQALFTRVTSFSAREVNQFGASTLINRITNDVQQVQMLVVMGCTLGVAAPITIVGGIVMALRQDAGLGWLLAVSLVGLTVAVGIIVTLMIPQFRKMQDRIDGINKILREQITGIRVVRAFVREREEVDRFEAGNDLLTATSLKAGRLIALMFPTLMLILNASGVGVLWFGSDHIENGSLTVGALVAFLTYFSLILIAVMMASFVAIMTPRAAVCAERIAEVLAVESTVTARPGAVTEVGNLGRLELRDVGFHYPGADHAVLEGISLRSEPGQTTAIIGSTGSGKTTLLNLVARLADASTGSVLVDGVDLRDLDPDVLWQRIGLIPQKPYLFTGTVASNLRYGKPDATEEELWEALTVAQASDFVAAMPGGLDAPIAQGGSNVSGGQRQRLAIARALVRRPEIYLFDDSFSALDLATDARLRAALAPYTAEATVIIVGQRISTIADADQILVLEDGETVGLGTHDELLETCATYAEIVDSQMADAT